MLFKKYDIFGLNPARVRCLAQTTGFYLTSIPGIGVPLAGHITAELGEPTRWLSVDNTASYAGIVCRQSQTGGADNPPVKGGLPPDCNHVFKDYLLQAAHHVGTTPMSILKELSVDNEHTLYKHHLSRCPSHPSWSLMSLTSSLLSRFLSLASIIIQGITTSLVQQKTLSYDNLTNPQTNLYLALNKAPNTAPQKKRKR